MTATESAEPAAPRASKEQALSVSVDIEVPAQVAYAAIADVTRMPEWSPETVRVRWLKPGERFIGINRMGRVRWATVCRVVAAEADKRFAFDVSFLGIPVARWSFGFASRGEHACTVTETWEDHRPGGAFGRVMRRVGAVLLRTPHDETDIPENMRQTLDRVRDRLQPAA